MVENGRKKLQLYYIFFSCEVIFSFNGVRVFVRGKYLRKAAEFRGSVVHCWWRDPARDVLYILRCSLPVSK